MSKKYNAIDSEIDHVLMQLGTMRSGSEEYCAAVKNLEMLYKARSYKDESKISMDTLALAVTNILGVILVLNYEHLHVISGKAINFIIKGKF
jgi:hypothetical protein